MANQLPLHRSGRLGTLFDRLLHAVLAHGAESITRGIIGGGGGLGLGYGQQLDFTRVAAGGGASGGDLGPDGVGTAGKFVIVNEHGMALEKLLKGLRQRVCS